MRTRSIHSVLMAMLLAGGLACRETLREAPQVALPSADAVEAALVLSRGDVNVGDTVYAAVRLTRGAAVQPAASFTARLSYDPQRLTFVDEASPSTAALRVVNGEIVGDVRVAGLATDGFRDGALVLLRFVATARGPIGAMQLAMDQLHAVDGVDLSQARVLAPTIDAGVAP